MKACITSAFRTTQGEKTRKNVRIPAQGSFLAFHAAHPHRAHSAGISVGFRSPANAQNAPAGMKRVRVTAIDAAAANTAVIRYADRHASHVNSGALNMGGAIAQNSPAIFAARAPKSVRPVYMASITVAREKISCTRTMIVAASDPVPKRI